MSALKLETDIGLSSLDYGAAMAAVQGFIENGLGTDHTLVQAVFEPALDHGVPTGKCKSHCFYYENAAKVAK